MNVHKPRETDDKQFLRECVQYLNEVLKCGRCFNNNTYDDGGDNVHFEIMKTVENTVNDLLKLYNIKNDFTDYYCGLLLIQYYIGDKHIIEIINDICNYFTDVKLAGIFTDIELGGGITKIEKDEYIITLVDVKNKGIKNIWNVNIIRDNLKDYACAKTISRNIYFDEHTVAFGFKINPNMKMDKEMI